MVDINDFNVEKECFYKGERYSVRDNGSVLRYPKESGKFRKLDNKWTFGKVDSKTGYLLIASERVHRIVATAFHGDPPGKNYVVDHIDTNRQNNRPENLRWVTRLENILLNPITVKRITNVCGSIENFLSNPEKYRYAFLEPSFEWMRRVTPEESRICLENLQNWAKSDKESAGKGLGQWIFEKKNNYINKNQEYQIQNGLVDSVNANAKQKNWKIPGFFSCCPANAENNPLESYYNNLGKAKTFFIGNTGYGEYKYVVNKFVLQNNFLLVQTVSDNSIKPYGLAKITFENGFYIHESLGTFFMEDGANKYFTIEQGLEWTGGDVFDDFC